MVQGNCLFIRGLYMFLMTVQCFSYVLFFLFFFLVVEKKFIAPLRNDAFLALAASTPSRETDFATGHGESSQVSYFPHFCRFISRSRWPFWNFNWNKSSRIVECLPDYKEYIFKKKEKMFMSSNGGKPNWILVWEAAVFNTISSNPLLTSSALLSREDWRGMWLKTEYIWRYHFYLNHFLFFTTSFSLCGTDIDFYFFVVLYWLSPWIAFQPRERSCIVLLAHLLFYTPLCKALMSIFSYVTDCYCIEYYDNYVL